MNALITIRHTHLTNHHTHVANHHTQLANHHTQLANHHTHLANGTLDEAPFYIRINLVRPPHATPHFLKTFLVSNYCACLIALFGGGGGGGGGGAVHTPPREN